MTIELEKIEMIRDRARVGYREAKEALEYSNNDMVEALIYLEAQHKVTGKTVHGEENGILKSIEKMFRCLGEYVKKGNEIRFVVEKEQRAVIDVPLNAVLVTTLFFPPVTIVGILAAVFTNHKIKFEKPQYEC